MKQDNENIKYKSKKYNITIIILFILLIISTLNSINTYYNSITIEKILKELENHQTQDNIYKEDKQDFDIDLYRLSKVHFNKILRNIKESFTTESDILDNNLQLNNLQTNIRHNINNNEMVTKIDVTGFSENDINISTNNNIIKVLANNKSNDNKNIESKKLYYSWNVDNNADIQNIKHIIKNNILTITIPLRKDK